METNAEMNRADPDHLDEIRCREGNKHKEESTDFFLTGEPKKTHRSFLKLPARIFTLSDPELLRRILQMDCPKGPS